jgi:uncharacterized membrane protein YbhN (UPF0104 family)
MKNKKQRQLLSVIVLVAVVVGIGLYLKANDELLLSWSNISLVAVFWLIISRLFFVAVNGLFLQAFTNKFNIKLGPKEWFGLAIVTAMGNYITPFSGGVAIRAVYLKHRYAFPYAQFAILFASNYLIVFWVIGVVGLVTLLIFIDSSLMNWQITFLFLMVTLAISVLIVLPTIKLPWNYRLVRVLNTSLEGWSSIKNDWFLLSKLVIYTLINILLNGVSFWIAYRALGFSVSFAVALLVGLLAVFSILLNITPGNLGIQEAVVSLSSAMLGVGAGQGLLAAFLVRSAAVVVAFTVGPIFSYVLAQDLSGHRSTSLPEDIPD